MLYGNIQASSLDVQNWIFWCLLPCLVSLNFLFPICRAACLSYGLFLYLLSLCSNREGHCCGEFSGVYWRCCTGSLTDRLLVACFRSRGTKRRKRLINFARVTTCCGVVLCSRNLVHCFSGALRNLLLPGYRISVS